MHIWCENEKSLDFLENAVFCASDKYKHDMAVHVGKTIVCACQL